MEKKAFCPNCGSEIDNEDVFCPDCGTQIIHTDTADNANEDKNGDGDETGKKRPKKKIIICIILAVVLCVLIFIGLYFFVFNHNANGSKGNESDPNDTVKTENTDAEEDSEYIFPNSDTEYLTDEDVSALTADELALARNEIIARHGRIFTDERYKSYFESKSWYEGTVQPEEFDANYENELNDIEKANIELIKKYEGLLAQDGSANKYYASILTEYQQAEESGFSGDSSTYPDVNKNLLKYGGGDLFYTLIDLCNDGVPELFISEQRDSDSADYEIVDIYGYEDGTPQHLNVGIDLGESPLDPNGAMGDRAHYTICENNMLKETGSSGADQNTVTYYELQKNSITLFIKDGAIKDGNNYYRNTTGLAADPSDQNEYETILNKYKGKKDITWKKLADFVSNSESQTHSSTVYDLANTYYGDFLRYYQEQEMNGFTTPDLELINSIFSNPEYFPKGYADSDTTLYYTVLDLADDGVPELFIGDGNQLYGAFAVIEGEGQVVPLFDLSMGEYTEYQLCKDNMIRGYERAGNVVRIIAYYRVEPHSYSASCSEAVYTDMSRFYFASLENGEWKYQSAATEQDFREMEEKYPVNEKIEWLKLSDF